MWVRVSLHPDSLRGLFIFIISFVSLVKIINVLVRDDDQKSEGWRPDPNSFLRTAASVDVAAAVNPNCNKTLLANGLSKLPIKGNPVFSDGPKSPPENPTDSPILCNWVFDNFILADELSSKASWIVETCVLVDNNLCGKLFSLFESPTTFYESFKVTAIPFIIPDFNLLGYELGNITFKVFHTESFYIDIILKQDKITILSQFLVKYLQRFLSLLQ